jgi:hypothetical protein
MKLTPLLRSFKVNIESTKKPSDSSDLEPSTLLNMSVKKQIEKIKSSPSLQNAFIDLINLEQVPQAIIDHQTGTVLPFDKDSRYPICNGENYTVVLNMKYAVENELFNYIKFWGEREFTSRFLKLLKKHTYYAYRFNEVDACNIYLLGIICNYLAKKIWNRKDGDSTNDPRHNSNSESSASEDNLNKLKKECKRLFYSDLDEDIASLELPKGEILFEENHDIKNRFFAYVNFLSGLGIKIPNDPSIKKIRDAIRKQIDKKVDNLVNILRNYNLSDLHKDKRDMLELNLLNTCPMLFGEKNKHIDHNTYESAQVDYYYQNEEYVKSSICNVNMSLVGWYTFAVNSLNGNFPNVTKLPDYFGSKDFDQIALTTELKLPDFPNLTTIGDYAFNDVQLKSISFGDMHNLTTIGNKFLYSANVGYIDLQELKNAKDIGKSFLRKITTKKIVMPPLPLHAHERGLKSVIIENVTPDYKIYPMKL